MFLLTSIQLLELSKAAVIFWTNPMIIAVIAYLTLKERLTKFDVLAIILAFFGILLIQNPF
jgi:drug/metabolite transporter (DMT)-like permease